MDTYNDAMCTVTFVFLFSSGLSQVLCTVALIRQTIYGTTPIFVYIFLIAIIVESFLVNVVVYGFAGDCNKQCAKSLSQLQQKNRSRHRDIFI